ncbi:MAG: extracellular solute-binding protein [Clostridia bacterium]|nr:extracellular solute-binding protein [Clostridia bacterium]
MRKTKFTRIACFALAFMFLVSTAVVAVSAADEINSFVTDKSIEDYGDELNTISYKEYIEKHAAFFQNPTVAETQTFDAFSGWTFVRRDGVEITLDGDKWMMTVYDRTKKDENGNPVVLAIYDSVEAAVKDGGYKKESLVYVEEIGGKKALYTPNDGSVTWTLDFAGKGLAEGLYSIELLYYPIIGKAAAIEREFYINGEAPFSEARSLSFAKLWGAFKPDETSPLTATYKLKKKDVMDTVVSEGVAAGLVCTPAEDGKSVVVERPTVITQAIYEYIEKYDLRFFITDATANELRPTMVQTPEWTSFAMRDSGGFFTDDFGFVLTPDANGQITITIDGVNESMALAEIRIKPYAKTQSYADYLASIKNNVGNLDEGTGTVKIEAELGNKTSTNGVYPIEDRTSPLTSPADTTRVMLNTIGTEKWAMPGQWVEYKFNVDGSGMYEIFTRYKQSYLDGMFVSRSLSIYTNYESEAAYKEKFGTTAGYYNGTPFAEAAELRYDYGTKWQVTGLSNGTDANGDKVADTYQIYFREGVTYTLRWDVTLGSMGEIVQRIENALNALNADYLSIIKLTGTEPDDYRDYGFSRLLPDTLIDMMQQAKNLEDISAFLKDTADTASTYTGTCDQLVGLLRKLAYDEDEIAKNLDNFKSYVGNLGTFLTDAKTQPLQLDYIMIQPASAEEPKSAANFFQTFWHECKSFYQSFIRDYNSMGAMDDGTTDATVDVWLAYGRDQSQVIRNMTTNKFTPETGIAVNLKLVSGGTLLPSILAGMGPDVYLGLADETVINYAIRGALTNIEGMEGFDEMVTACFNRAAMLQLEIADADGDVHTYGLPETQTFQMMFVRLDILYEVGIEIPKTWEDIYTAQSILESNNMEIGVTTNYKIFLYQSNGDLYADDGMRINLDSIKGLAAFEKMCNMFTQHSFPYSYSAANRFRTGEMPIIISDYTGLYNQLKVFATEIEGKWAFVPVPGTLYEDKSINNTTDSTIAAVVMISNIDDEASAWKFMKWYTGAEAQSDYANEMVAIIGDSAKHPTANRLALETMPWTQEEYEEVAKQFENLAAIPNYPGSYFIGRHANFAFLAALNDDADPTTEILSYINTINKEITRKREEFQLETLEIGQTLASKRMNQAMNAIDNLTKKYIAEGDTRYTEAIEAAKYAVANQKIAQLGEAANMFETILSQMWDGKMIDVTKVNGQVVSMPSYYKNVCKQTAESQNGGYRIDSLNEQQLVYFISVCFNDAAKALTSYQ